MLVHQRVTLVPFIFIHMFVFFGLVMLVLFPVLSMFSGVKSPRVGPGTSLRPARLAVLGCLALGGRGCGLRFF